jgi:hypothetical protein
VIIMMKKTISRVRVLINVKRNRGRNSDLTCLLRCLPGGLQDQVLGHLAELIFLTAGMDDEITRTSNFRKLAVPPCSVVWDSHFLNAFLFACTTCLCGVTDCAEG